MGGESQIGLMVQVKAGDCIILRQGLSKVVAVGKVVVRNQTFQGCGDKGWLQDFDGWNLPAYCYVDWHVPGKPVEASSIGLTRGTIVKVGKQSLKQIADSVIMETLIQHTREDEPAPTKKVEDVEILEFLIREGLRPASAEELTSAFRRIRLLARYYYNDCRWSDIREHETRTFLIMPLLLALGWAEQQIKIELGIDERKRVDVACFSKPYRRDSDGASNHHECVLLLESKDFSSGLDYAPKQALEYARSFSKCRVVVVSNGYCYETYLRDSEDKFSEHPSAYLNLLNPQDRYPLNPTQVGGALEVLRLLLPRPF